MVSQLLDFLLGHGHVALFRRAELKTLVNLHGNEVCITDFLRFLEFPIEYPTLWSSSPLSVHLCDLPFRCTKKLYNSLTCHDFYYATVLSIIFISHILFNNIMRNKFICLGLFHSSIWTMSLLSLSWLLVRLEKVENWHMMRQQLLLEHLSSQRKQLVMLWLPYLKLLQLISMPNLTGDMFCKL